MAWVAAFILTSLMASAVVLEIYDKPTGGLWFLIVVWILLDSGGTGD